MSKKQFPLRILCQTALLAAVEIVLNRFCSVNTMGLKIGVSFLPVALCGMLYGPAWAAACGSVADLTGALLFPFGPYHPGFTVCAALMGAVYGLLLHRWPEHRGRAFLSVLTAALVNDLVLGLGLNTLWVAQLYGSRTYWGWFVYRLSQYAILIPLNLILLPLTHGLAARIRRAGVAGERGEDHEL